MAPDPKLVEVARAAEAGHPLPVLRLTTAAQLVVGTPGASAGFNESTWGPITDEIGKTVSRGEGVAWTPKQAKQKAADMAQRGEMTAGSLHPGWGPAANAPEPDPPENLTLYGALVWGWGESSGLRVPAMRVRLEAISAWWPGHGEVIKGSGGWFVFVALPINLGN